MYRNVPGGPVVKNPPSNAGDAGWSLVDELRSHVPPGNQAHAPQLESPRAATREARAPQLRAQVPGALESMLCN